MSTVPSVPTQLSQPLPNVSVTGFVQAPQKELHIISAYLKAHEKLIIAVLILATTIGLYSKVIGWLYQHDKLKDQQAHEAAQAQIAQAAAIASQNAEKEAQYQDLKKQLDATRAQLNAEIAQRDTATIKQQVVDQSLPLTGLQSRWVDLLGTFGVYGAENGVHFEGNSLGTDTGKLYVEEGAARATVSKLEEVSQLEADSKDQKAIIADDATQIAALGNLNTGLHTQIDSLNGVIVKNGAACEADKTLIKAEARKSKLKWAIGGFIAGFLLRSIIHPGAGAVSPTAVGNVSVPAL